MAVTNAAPQRPQPAPAPSRMSLKAVITGRQEKPLRVLLYGVEGIGKSTFGAGAPAPIFLASEDGTSHLDVTRLPMPQTWQEVLDAVQLLTVEEHPYKTLVIDTLDWVEPMLWAHICKRDSQPNIESYGYGKGYSAALDEWRIFLAALERMRERRGMHLVLLAHSWIKPFKNPEGDDYDRFEMKLHPKAGGLLKEWVDCVLFTNYETFAEADKRTKRVKGISTGARLIYSTRTAAYDAKNRHSLPEQLPLDWNEFFTAARTHQPAAPATLEDEIRRKAAGLHEADKTSALAAITRAGGNAEKLAQLNDWVNAKLNLMQEAV